MTAQIIQIRDYQRKEDVLRARELYAEELARLEAEIAVQLWFNDAGTVGIPHYMAPDKDPA